MSPKKIFSMFYQQFYSDNHHKLTLKYLMFDTFIGTWTLATYLSRLHYVRS
jgi:hypothetical protein